jgi:hypothetical protein
MGLKKGWLLTSEAPAREPSRLISSFTRSFRTTDLQRLGYRLLAESDEVEAYGTHFETCGELGWSGKGTSSLNIFANVAFRFLPLKGVVPNSISYIRIPKVHQSTALVWPLPLITSGAMYSSVPTNELVLKSAMQDFVSTKGYTFELAPFRPPAKTIVGTPPESDCFDKSKSESMIWPD